jgi:CheY-like chemotaxis protein
MINILYVDDEEDLLLVGKKFLEKDPEIHVDTVDSAELGIKMLEEKYYDAIVSDYQMPRMDGIAFLKYINDNFKKRKIPFIIFTGRGREEVVIEAINNGATFYLQKGGEPKSQFAELISKLKIATSKKELEDTYESIYQLISEMVIKKDLQKNLDNIAVVISKRLFADGSFLMLLNKKTEQLECKASYNLSDKFKERSLKPKEGLAGKVMREHKGCFTDEYVLDATIKHDDQADFLVKNEGIVSGIAAPLQISGICFGVIYAINKKIKPFTEKDLATLSLFGNLAAMAIISDEIKQQKEYYKTKIKITKNEIANSIFIIKGYLDFLEEEKNEKESKEEYIKKTESIISIVRKLIETLEEV